MVTCKFATKTNRSWLGASTHCFVIECRSPEAKEKLKYFKDEKGIEYPAVRRPCDEHFNLLPNADYLHVREKFCNERFCPYYVAKENESKESR